MANRVKSGIFWGWAQVKKNFGPHLGLFFTFLGPSGIFSLSIGIILGGIDQVQNIILEPINGDYQFLF